MIKLDWPVPSNTPISGTYDDTHKALDLACVIGTPVRACADGEVCKTGSIMDDGYGLFVKLQHDGFTSISAHLSDKCVYIGDIVKTGDIIGYSGNSGTSTGPHLHFETRLGLDYHDYSGHFDPMPYLTGVNVAPIDTETGVNDLTPGRYRQNGYMNVRRNPSLDDNLINGEGSINEFTEIKYDPVSGNTFGKIEVTGWMAIDDGKGHIFAEKIA